MARLGEICKFQSGGTPAKSDSSFYGGNIPWITTVALNGSLINDDDAVDWITEKAINNSAAKIVPENSVMVGTRVGVGKVARNCIPMSTSQDIISLIGIDENIWDKDYICKFIGSKNDYLNSQARGATIKGIKIEILDKLEVPNLGIAQQKRVSSIIDKVNTLISLRQQQLEKLDQLVKSRFIEMFGSLPTNEKQWEIATVRDVTTEVRYGSSRPAVDGGRYPYLRMNNITYSGELDLSDIKQIDIPENELQKCTVRRGDVLFNRTNSKELVGKTCVYNRDEMMVLAGFVIRVRVNEKMLPEFLSAFLNTDFSKQMLLGMCKAAIGQANINAQELQNIELYVPPITMQKNFVAFKQHVDKSKFEIQQSLEKLEILKKALMQKYFG